MGTAQISRLSNGNSPGSLFVLVKPAGRLIGSVKVQYTYTYTSSPFHLCCVLLHDVGRVAAFVGQGRFSC